MKFNIGDTVKIIDSGEVYAHYREKFELFQFKNTELNDIPENYNDLTWSVIGETSIRPNLDHHPEVIIIPIQSNVGHQLVMTEVAIEKY